MPTVVATTRTLIVPDLTSILSIYDVDGQQHRTREPKQPGHLPVRAIAKSAVQWHCSKLDHQSCNEDNVQTVLRTVIAHITTELLSPSSENNSNNNNCRSISDLVTSPASTSSSSSSTHPLSRRHQARMEALLAGCALAVPNQKNTTTKIYSQIPAADLQVRIELYLRSLQRFVVESNDNDNTDECVLGTESDKGIRARARIVTNAFVATATYVGNVTAILTRLLVCLTMEVLAVEHVSDDELINKVMKRRVVSEYIHGTSFASLAFLSTPEVNADTLLTPLIIKYLQMLQKDWKRWVHECEMERLIVTRSSLQASTRSLFKTIEFQSIGHLMEVCHEYHSELRGIKVPCDSLPQVASHRDNCLSVKQLKYHVITMNGLPFPPISGSETDLVEMLTSAITNVCSVANNDGTASRSKKPTGNKGKNNRSNVGDRRSPLQLRKDVNVYNDDSSFTMESCDDCYSSDTGRRDVFASGKKPKTQIAKMNNVSRADSAMLAQRIARKLFQSLRQTGTYGIALHFVKDLFGGDSVRVIPTTTSMNHILELRKRGFNGTLTIDLTKSTSNQPSQVVITIHECFDIYPNDLPHETGYGEPLVQFHTTSTTTIEVDSERNSSTMLLSIRPFLHQEL